jgi:hypothetical protein
MGERNVMRTYLDVPYSEKDDAKRLGARWDIARKKWFVEDADDLMLFGKWIKGVGDFVEPKTTHKTKKKKHGKKRKTPSSVNEIEGKTIRGSKFVELPPLRPDEAPWHD